MKYQNIVYGSFLERPNRFTAVVQISGKPETVHVKNTGRCRELLLPQAQVALQRADHPNRKTQYDLIGVYKDPLGWVNIDSQAPNQVVKDWLMQQEYTFIKPEYTYGTSRLDFYMEKGEERFLMEVKGCTLEIDGIGFFPDAPSQRAVKHMEELIRGKKEGFHSIIAFVIPMEGIEIVMPNRRTHPEFADTLEKAEQAGVEIWYLACRVTADSLEIANKKSSVTI